MGPKKIIKSVLCVVGSAALYSCCISSGMTQSQLQDVLTQDQTLKSFYDTTAQTVSADFLNPAFGGNFAEWRTNDTIKFSDNTVYLGNYLAWRAASLSFADRAAAGAALEKVIGHIVDDLVVPTTLPGTGEANSGYFRRDNMTATSVTIDDKTWSVQSDSQNGDDNQMSQDQLIHVLFGYWNVVNFVNQYASSDSWSQGLLSKARSHAHQIGLRLKAYNYMVVDPSGQNVKRGADARGFAWPIAKTIANITGQDLSTYLTSIKAVDENRIEIKITADQLKDSFSAAITGLTTGVCSIKIGGDKHDLCNRFTLRLINALYVTSGMYKTHQFYVSQMEKDGDDLGALQTRILSQMEVPDRYVDTLNSAKAFQCSAGPELWCTDFRWIRMPSSCPDSCDAGNPYHYSGLDYLLLYAVSRTARK
jgi:hypothetical protein